MSAHEMHANQPAAAPSTGASPCGSELQPLNITAAALNKLRAFQAENEEFRGKSFRVFIEGGGCSGFNYGFVFDDVQPENDDATWLIDGFPVVCDPMSYQYLKGATVDYVETLNGSGFTVQNPNAKTSCGCGHSFGV